MEDKTTTLLAERHLGALKAMLVELQPADLAQYFAELAVEDEPDLPVVFRILPKELAAETFAYMEGDLQEKLILGFSDAELSGMMNRLSVDDAADALDELPANLVDRVLRQTPPQKRRRLNEILDYPDDSAGSIMTVEYVDLRPAMTVADALAKIRRVGLNSETIYTCYVTENRRLTGLVTARQLLISDESTRIVEIMEHNVISVYTHEDKESVADKLSKYDFGAIPVVDNEMRLVGIVTFDDAMDVMREAATEDMEKMAAIVPTDRPYMKIGVFETWSKRIPWLLLLMISATFTGKILQHFEDALAAQIALTMFIPMLMDTGGNAGGQASVTIIRGLSLGELQLRNIFRIMWKELRVALLCGLTLALANFVKMLLIDRISLTVAAVVCLTLVLTVVIAKLVGCSLPLLAKRIGFDPAVMASPFITTVVDALSLLIYFNIARLLLGI